MSVIKEAYLSRSVTRADLLPLSFLKKSAYTGSKGHLRYRMEKAAVPESLPDAAGETRAKVLQDEEAAKQAFEAAWEMAQGDGKTGEAAESEEKPEKPSLPVKTVLRCYVWDTPYILADTPDEEVRVYDFPFSDEGIDAAAACLNACHQTLLQNGERDRQEDACAPDPLPLLRKMEQLEAEAASKEQETKQEQEDDDDADADADADAEADTDTEIDTDE